MQGLADEVLTTRMYKALISLELGQVVPAEIYIADYKDGKIPTWHVVEKRPPGASNPDLYVLVLEDRDNCGKVDLFNPTGRAIRKMVIATPRKILGSPPFLPVEGKDYGPSMLHDLVQNARLHRKPVRKREEVNDAKFE